jgi:hypothetical protein
MDPSELEAGYEEISQDAEREAEALEWCESLIGDALSDFGGENSRSLDSGDQNRVACARDDNLNKGGT